MVSDTSLFSIHAFLHVFFNEQLALGQEQHR
jgi:hypothetical protein